MSQLNIIAFLHIIMLKLLHYDTTKILWIILVIIFIQISLSFRNMSGLTKEQLEKFEKDGILIIENFLSPEDVSSIRAEYCCNIL